MESISRRSLTTIIAAAVAAVPTLALSAVPFRNPGTGQNMVDRVRALARSLMTDPHARQDFHPDGRAVTWGEWQDRRRTAEALLRIANGEPLSGFADNPVKETEPVLRVAHLTNQLAAAMRDLHGVEVEVLTYDATEGSRPMVMVVALT
jgi:hypothetical protein